jgi:ArsR family transcriptional regulator
MGAMDNLVVQLKALGDENRFRIMMMLRERPLCSCELLEVLDIAGGTLSAHLKILKESGLMSQDKKGRWVECSISNDNAAALLGFLSQRIASTELFKKDLALIRQKSPAAP